MSEKFKRLIDAINYNKSILEEDFFDEELIGEIIQLNDLSDFHLILNYIEKINLDYGIKIMNKKRKQYTQLIDSYDEVSGYFSRDEYILNEISHYLEHHQFNKKLLTSKFESIDQKYSNIINNFTRIKYIIKYGIYDAKNYNEILSEIKRKLNLTNDEMINLEELYDDIKDYYTLNANLYDQDEIERQVLLGKIRNIYPRAIQDTIITYTQNGNLNEIAKLIKQQNASILRDILMSNFFEDVPENFAKNLLNVVNFQLEIDENFIEKDLLNIFRRIINLFNEQDSKIVYDFYKSLQNKNCNYVSEFYDVFTSARKICAKMLMDSVLDLNNSKLNKMVVEGIECYLLEGEPFYMIVHSSSHKINDFQDQNAGISMSFISDERLCVYNERVIYGFTHLLPSQFIELYTKDAATDYDIGNEKKSLLGVVPEFHKPNEFIEKTSKYSINEILYLSGKKDTNDQFPDIVAPKPSYIVCYDKINEESIESARELHIPIVVVDTKKYYKRHIDNMGHFAFRTDQDTYRTTLSKSKY